MFFELFYPKTWRSKTKMLKHHQSFLAYYKNIQASLIFLIDGSVNALKECVSKELYFLSFPDGWAGILGTIIFFGTLCWRAHSCLLFSNSFFWKIPILSFLLTHFVVIKFFLSFLLSLGCSIFLLHKLLHALFFLSNFS